MVDGIIHRIDHHKSSQSHENPIMPWQGEPTLGALAALLLQLGRLLSQLFPQLLSKLLRPPLSTAGKGYIEICVYTYIYILYMFAHTHTTYVYTHIVYIYTLLAYTYIYIYVIYIYIIISIHIHIGTITISGGDHQTSPNAGPCICIYILYMWVLHICGFCT